jgi:hypothetical protein
VAKIKYNNTDVEPGTFKQPTPGLYTMAITEANHRDENGKNDIEVILEVVGGEFDKAKIWSYVGLSEASAWKFRELTDALGLPPAGELDTNKLIGKKMKVKVNADQWQGEYRARAGRFAPLDAGAAAESSNGEVEEAAPKSSRRTSSTRTKAKPAPEPEPEPEDDAPDYSEWSIEDMLEAINEDETLKAKLPEGFEDDAEFLADFLAAADESDEALQDLLDQVEGEEGEGEEEDDDTPDYATMSLDELKEEVERRGLKLPKGRVPKPRLIKMLEADDSDGSDPFKS